MNKNLVYAIFGLVLVYLSAWITVNFVLPAAILKINYTLNILEPIADTRFLLLSLVAAVVGYVGGEI